MCLKPCKNVGLAFKKSHKNKWLWTVVTSICQFLSTLKTRHILRGHQKYQTVSHKIMQILSRYLHLCTQVFFKIFFPVCQLKVADFAEEPQYFVRNSNNQIQTQFALTGVFCGDSLLFEYDR